MATESVAGAVNSPVVPTDTRVVEPQTTPQVREIAQTEVTLSQRSAEVIPSTEPSAAAVEQAANRPEIERALEQVQVMMDLRDRSISFQRDNEAGAEVIRITDDSTGEVIRQMPSEELLGFMKNLTKMLGAFFDQTS
jgi:flagellar protein FlaG